jgi:hypothetical protein
MDNRAQIAFSAPAPDGGGPATISGPILDEPRRRPQDYAIAHDVDARMDTARTATEFDVAALIINKMIGTGIFTGPFTVLQFTHNKSVAIGLWVLGFGYTILRYAMKPVIALQKFES